MPSINENLMWQCNDCAAQFLTYDPARAHEKKTHAPQPEDLVHEPAHYNQGDVECIDAIASALGPEAFKGYLHGNAIKYLWRHRYKGNEVQDLEKATWYINKLKEQHETKRIPGTSSTVQSSPSSKETSRSAEDELSSSSWDREVPETD